VAKCSRHGSAACDGSSFARGLAHEELDKFPQLLVLRIRTENVLILAFSTSQRSRREGLPSNLGGQMWADADLPTASETVCGTWNSFSIFIEGSVQEKEGAKCVRGGVQIHTTGASDTEICLQNAAKLRRPLALKTT